MHEHIMTDADQNKADAIKNEILDLCLARKVSALVALSASRCAAECFESIIKEQGGEVFEVNGISDSARRAAEEISSTFGLRFQEDSLQRTTAIISKHFAAAPAESVFMPTADTGLNCVYNRHPYCTKAHCDCTCHAAPADDDAETKGEPDA